MSVQSLRATAREEPVSAGELAFASDRSGRNQVWTVNTEDPGHTLHQVTTAGSGSQESRTPDWSATIGGIAYQFGASGVRGIHRINADGTRDRILFAAHPELLSPLLQCIHRV